MRIKDLKPHLKARILSIQGNKGVRLTQLNDGIRDGLPRVENIATEIFEMMAGEVFPPTAHW